MKLVIAEKPSVAQAIANVLGVKEKKDGYFEGNGYAVSWCVGHLVELSLPESYGEEYKSMRKYPIFPNHWNYNIKESSKKQFVIVKDLMNDQRITSLVCATEVG